MTKQKSNKKYSFLLFLLVLLSCFQNLILVELSAFSLKVFHVYALIFALLMLLHKQVKFPTAKLLIYYLYIVLLSLIMSTKWGIGGLIVNYTFGLYLISIFCTFGQKFELKDFLGMFQKVAWVMLFAVSVNIAMQYKQLVYFFNNTWMGHPSINTIWGGGVNLEATWLALLGFSFLGNKFKWIYISVSTLIASLLASRVGILIDVMCLVWIIIAENTSRDAVKTILRILTVALFAFLILAIVAKTGAFDIVLDRFKDVGNDSGSVGRQKMWDYAFETMEHNPLGVGIGNAIKALSEIAGMQYSENNLHNLYMQNIIELGFIGGIWYICIVLGFVKKEFKNLFKNPFVAMLFVYILMSFLQFRGGEPLVFSIIGVYLCLKRKA